MWGFFFGGRIGDARQGSTVATSKGALKIKIKIDFRLLETLQFYVPILRKVDGSTKTPRIICQSNDQS